MLGPTAIIRLNRRIGPYQTFRAEIVGMIRTEMRSTINNGNCFDQKSVPATEFPSSFTDTQRTQTPTQPRHNMKVFALTLLCLAAVAQAHVSYRLQCARGEIGIRWPSYHSNSEYFVCQGVYGSQLTIHCPPGEVFTFVLQQCAAPSHYIPAPPIDVLPTAAPITMTVVEDAPPVIAAGPLSTSTHNQFEQNETIEHHEHHEHEHKPEEEVIIHPIPPTPAPEPPVMDSAAKPVSVPMPHKVSGVKKPVVPAPAKKPVAAAKKPVAPIPAKAAKKPTPPSKAQKKPATA